MCKKTGTYDKVCEKSQKNLTNVEKCDKILIQLRK